ncbi:MULTISPECIES: hypothetical protein [unclassified Streptomyces]
MRTVVIGAQLLCPADAATTAISTVGIALTLIARGWPCRPPDVR